MLTSQSDLRPLLPGLPSHRLGSTARALKLAPNLSTHTVQVLSGMGSPSRVVELASTTSRRERFNTALTRQPSPISADSCLGTSARAARLDTGTARVSDSSLQRMLLLRLCLLAGSVPTAHPCAAPLLSWRGSFLLAHTIHVFNRTCMQGR